MMATANQLARLDNPYAQAKPVEGPTILLHSGNYFHFLDPRSSIFTIEDIAHALSHICRFNGHVKRFYSVGQHVCHAHDVAPDSHKYAALHHDDPEAFIGDMARPLKEIMPQYRELENVVEVAVFERFAVPALDSVIKTIDMRMLHTEQDQLMRPGQEWSWTKDYPAYDFEIPVWTPERTKAEYLARHFKHTNIIF